MSFKVPDLLYAFDALEPHIDARTMEIHHDKHHAAYVNMLNGAVEAAGDACAGKSVEELITNLDSVPEAQRGAVRNHGGGHYNHSLFWTVMAADGGSASEELATAIDMAFG
ncbi:MAG: superoxide dismutase, partial [Candidatus Poseidoniia archaeon]|nr:superoxide dismutase [Candidatus Poseidoniia archaeon]